MKNAIVLALVGLLLCLLPFMVLIPFGIWIVYVGAAPFLVFFVCMVIQSRNPNLPAAKKAQIYRGMVAVAVMGVLCFGGLLYVYTLLSTPLSIPTHPPLVQPLPMPTTSRNATPIHKDAFSYNGVQENAIMLGA